MTRIDFEGCDLRFDGIILFLSGFFGEAARIATVAVEPDLPSTSIDVEESEVATDGLLRFLEGKLEAGNDDWSPFEDSDGRDAFGCSSPAHRSCSA